MKIRSEISPKPSNVAPVTFHDVAAYFSEEEWKTMSQWQKELYQDVMKEVHQALFSLGHQIVNTNVFLRISNRGKASFRDPEKSTDVKDPNKPRSSPVQPDILFRIKQEEKLFCRDWYWAEEPGAKDGLLKDVSLRRKREDTISKNDRRQPDRRESDDGLRVAQEQLAEVGFPCLYSTSLRRKGESKSGLMDHRGAEREETITCPNSGISVIIKKEETYSEDQEDLESRQVLEAPLDGGSMAQERNTELYVASTEKNTSLCAASSENGKASFSENIGFIKHQITQAVERSHQCLECDKSFSQKVNLIRHQRTHTGERPYHCTECEKRFSHKHHLKGHQRTHTGERPYHCAKCGKSFSWKESLSRHQRTHSADRPYQCTECVQSFTLKESFLRHQVTHMREIFNDPLSAARPDIPQSVTFQRTGGREVDSPSRQGDVLLLISEGSVSLT